MAFRFSGGRLCLNFAATLGTRHTTPIERLPNQAALARWIAEAGLADGPDAVDASSTVMTDVRELREAIYRLVLAVMHGQDLAHEDLARVNTASAQPDLAPQLDRVSQGTGDRLQPAIRWMSGAGAGAGVATVARDAVVLLSSPVFTRVKECENPECSLLFFDESQARRRRWCSMERCGNLAKLATYRSRPRHSS